MNSSRIIYGKRRSGGEHGDVPTSPEVVRFMLDQSGYTAERDLRNIAILEPSCGEGEFVVEIAARILRSSAKYHFDAEEAFQKNLQAYDIAPHKVAICRERVRRIGIQSTQNIIVADFLKTNAKRADIVVGNPPYVRYENIPPEIRYFCKKAFSTFHYRSDLYIPFFEKTLSLLNEGGIHCFICSDRWLKSKYGKKLRLHISTSYRLELLINMENADAFLEDVSAYPAITQISAKSPSGIFEYAECDAVSQLKNLKTTNKKLPMGADWTGAFNDTSGNKNLLSIEEQGFKIGIGVATGADSVFISKSLIDEIEPELILPAINARDLRGNNLQWQEKYLLNPYTPDGGLINLEFYPRAKKYLEAHRDKLSKRHIASKFPSRWYRTIDRILPAIRNLPKILLPDMSGNTFVFVDDGKYYPLHNIYYITGPDKIHLRILAAILMSDFVRDQLVSVTNRMNGGFPRWQSQHLRKLRLPDISSFSGSDVQFLLSCYDRKDISEINAKIKELSKIHSESQTSRFSLESNLQLAV